MIIPIACLKDNYAYLVVCDATKKCAVVDPSEAAPVIDAAKRAGVVPEAIWNTHHHWDHVGGNEELAAHFHIDAVFGHASDKGRIAKQSRFLEEGQRFEHGKITVSILHIPGHTTGAIAYVLDGEGDSPAVFTGDTLFVAGCGRLFEGTPEMMFVSFGKLAKLDARTRVYCGHEYTASNLKFAAHAEPDNADVKRAASSVEIPSVPSTIAQEKLVNVFMRAKDANAFGALRAAKDSFKG
jgi:hydroxyacylglutathione hydrolase